MSSKHPYSNKKGSHYIPGLDGLRALAVLAVVLYHLFPYILPGGYVGVDIFFVISGFLITTLLINEHARSGRINLRKFWIRRVRRLLPALCVTILVISSVVFFVHGDIRVGIGQQILGASTFSSNWVEVVAGTNYFENNSAHLFMNFWSLAVEEQFYLLWPFVILLLIGIIKKPRIGMALTGLLALVSAGLMVYLFSHGASSSRVYYGTDTHIFGLMIGAFLAFWARTKTIGQGLRRLSQPFWHLRRFPLLTRLSGSLALGAIVILLFTLPNQTPLAYSGGLLLACILTAIVLVATISTNDWLQKLFSQRTLVWIGTRSYGIYLWHWPILVLLVYLLPDSIPWWTIPGSLLILTFSAVALSHRYLEMPIRSQGFRKTFRQILKRRLASTNKVPTRIYLRSHSIVPIILALCILTMGAVISAPTKTTAQASIEKGQKAIQEQAKTIPPPAQPTHISQPKKPEPSKQPAPVPITGKIMTVVGDSVTLASSPSLQEYFPDILINAEVSRSLRIGGFDTIDQLEQAGQLRPIVIVALGTNGYYGTDNLERLATRLRGHNIVLVTAHADRKWTVSNNDGVHAMAQKYGYVAVAEWDQTIAPHPELLSPDGVHPLGSEGGKMYAGCINEALKKFK